MRRAVSLTVVTAFRALERSMARNPLFQRYLPMIGIRKFSGLEMKEIG